MRRSRILGAAVAILSALTPACSPTDWTPDPADEGYQQLELDQKTRAVLDWENLGYVSFLVDVPEDAMVLTLEVAKAPVDLDLYARHELPILSYEEDAEFVASSWLFNDTLRISRSGTPALQTGTYYVDVAYTIDAVPRVGKRKLARIPFEISAVVIHSRVDGGLEPGVPLTSQTDAESGWFRTFTVEVPDDASTLRIDLDGVTGDLDLVAGLGGPVLDLDTALHKAESLLGRETLLLDRDGDPPLESGTWFVNVYDPYELDRTPFTAHLSFEPLPAPQLLALPTIRRPKPGLDRAVLATVDVIAGVSGGSGTLLSPDGWVLTNFHVLETESGLPIGEGELVISLCLDPRKPPAELFRGSVVLSDPDLDLALVKIETGLYGQPLPADFAFPYLELGDADAVELGDPITVLGFPGVGGLGSRATVTLTRGVISGFDSYENGPIFKTDAEIGPGNSGGAALDRNWRLIGVPAKTVGDAETYSQIGYILPVSRISAAWRERIGR